MGTVRTGCVIALIGVLLAGPAIAQETNSHLEVVVTDNEGGVLAGVTVELSGLGLTQLQITDPKGEARFLKLDPGFATVTATLDGFSPVEHSEVAVRLGRGTAIRIEMTPALKEAITVTGEVPLLDESRVETGVTIGRIELDKVPSTGIPWDLMSRTPGVVTDRINVGGSESYSPQKTARAPGTDSDENNILLDGIDVTDMAAIGAASMFFDLDQVAELQLTTGGADVTKLAAGVAMNLVTKRGTNEFRGSAHFEITDRDGLLFFDRSEPDTSSDLAPGQESFVEESVERIDQWGFEAGGPVVRDRLWFWGSYGVRDGSYLSSANTHADVLPKASNFPFVGLKIHAQVSQRNSALASWNNSDRVECCRNAGPTRPAPTTWDQRGPTEHLKLEDTHIFNSSFFLTGTYAETNGGFQLISNGVKALGNDAPQSNLDDDGVWHGSFWNGSAARPQNQYQIDGSYFFNTGSVSHELKFGARLRDFETQSAFGWSNDNAWSIEIGAGLSPALLFTQRGVDPHVTQDYKSAWVQDTISAGSWTINAGFRYDLQEAENLPIEVEGNLWFPELQPGLSYDGAQAPFDWETISPRIGVTYALGEERKTLLRGSFSRYTQQLASEYISRINPAKPSYSTMLWFDADGSGDYNGCPDCAREGPDPVILIGWSGWDPADPTSLESANRTDPGLDPEITDEMLLAVEHAIRPELVVGATLTLRNIHDILETRALVREEDGTERLVRHQDFVFDRTLTGNVPTTGTPYSVDAWALDPDLSYTGGTFLTNGDRERDYLGLGLTATKRLTNRWMARGYIQWGEAQWDVPGSFLAGQSPNLCEDDNSLGCNGATGGNIDGGLFAEQSSRGGKTDVWSQSTWQFNVNGMVQIAPDRPWGFNVAANIFGREGYPLPYFVNVTTFDGQNRDLLAFDELDRFRVDDILTVDLRLDKEFAASGNTSFTVGIDLFNVFNNNPVMQRERQLTSGQADWLRQVLGPRIWRLGVRLNWR